MINLKRKQKKRFVKDTKHLLPAVLLLWVTWGQSHHHAATVLFVSCSSCQCKDISFFNQQLQHQYPVSSAISLGTSRFYLKPVICRYIQLKKWQPSDSLGHPGIFLDYSTLTRERKEIFDSISQIFTLVLCNPTSVVYFFFSRHTCFLQSKQTLLLMALEISEAHVIWKHFLCSKGKNLSGLFTKKEQPEIKWTATLNGSSLLNTTCVLSLVRD